MVHPNVPATTSALTIFLLCCPIQNMWLFNHYNLRSGSPVCLPRNRARYLVTLYLTLQPYRPSSPCSPPAQHRAAPFRPGHHLRPQPQDCAAGRLAHVVQERRTASQSNPQNINQNGLHATSGFEMCFAIGSQHLWCRGSRPKHVSNPAYRYGSLTPI